MVNRCFPSLIIYRQEEQRAGGNTLQQIQIMRYSAHRIIGGDRERINSFSILYLRDINTISKGEYSHILINKHKSQDLQINYIQNKNKASLNIENVNKQSDSYVIAEIIGFVLDTYYYYERDGKELHIDIIQYILGCHKRKAYHLLEEIKTKIKRLGGDSIY